MKTISPWPQVIFLSKSELSVKRAFPVNRAAFGSSLCAPAIDTKPTLSVCIYLSNSLRMIVFHQECVI